MANPTVEKLKELGLRFGDKAAVALMSLLFLVCFGMAVSKKAIDTTPDEIKKAAESADSNIGRRRERDAIVKTLEDVGIKPTNFAMQVEETTKSVLVADTYKPYREWVTPEPGAGLMRDTPTLIAPTDLFAYPGRGGALVYALDEQGNRIPDTDKKEAPKEAPRRKRRRRGAMSGGMGMAMGGARKKCARARLRSSRNRRKRPKSSNERSPPSSPALMRLPPRKSKKRTQPTRGQP